MHIRTFEDKSLSDLEDIVNQEIKRLHSISAADRNYTRIKNVKIVCSPGGNYIATLTYDEDF
jgi:hypothetical protein